MKAKTKDNPTQPRGEPPQAARFIAVQQKVLRATEGKVKPVCALGLILLGALTGVVGARLSVASRATDGHASTTTVTVQAAGRGHPWMNLRDGRPMQTPDTGAAKLTEMMAQPLQPTALAAADFDEDGVPDVIGGYASADGGIITLHRGNLEALWPRHQGSGVRDQGPATTDHGPWTTDAPPFWPEAYVFEVEAAPDYLGAGDFDADGHWDVVAAARGSHVLYWLPGNGRGGFDEVRGVELPGPVTALVTGEINRRDGLTDVVVGVVGVDGPQALVFEGLEGALPAEPEVLPLPAEATALAVGQVDDGYEIDLVITAGTELVMVSGRDRNLSLGEARRGAVPAPRFDQRSFDFVITALAVGDFVRDEAQRADIALLAEDGTIHVLTNPPPSGETAGTRREAPVPGVARGRTSVRVAVAGRSRGLVTWPSQRFTMTAGPQATGLARGKVSSLPTDDLVVLDRANHQLHILSNLNRGNESTSQWGNDSLTHLPIDSWITTLDADGAPVAVLPMRLNADGTDDLVILQDGSNTPTIVLSAPLATLTVNSTADTNDGVCDSGTPGGCTLREAIAAANGSPGADVIEFDIGSGTPTITIGSMLEITDQVTIDGSLGPGGATRVELDGSGMSGSDPGLRLSGGTNTVLRNLVINRFPANGLELMSTTSMNLIEGCFIGTDATGMMDQGNGNIGVLINGSSNNTIGGTMTAQRNLISGNNAIGIWIVPGIFGATGNMVLGNYIGLAADGATAVGNTAQAIVIQDVSNNTIGSAGAGNVISGNTNTGVEISGFNGATGNLVQGNFIGTDAAGAMAVPNTSVGVSILAANSTTIGGTGAGAGNVISGNFSGVVIEGDFSGNGSMNLVQGNKIGTQADGASMVGNLLDGLSITGSAHSNTIGEAVSGAANIIAFNGRVGVNLLPTAGTGNQILSNSIFSNSGLGIDLNNDGVTASDAGDPDAGPNNLQNSPLLMAAEIVDGHLMVRYRVDSTTTNSFYPLTIEFFKSDSAVSGEGQTFLTSDNYTSAQAQTVKTVDLGVAASLGVMNGDPLVATATDANGNTSEFGAVVTEATNALAFVVNSTLDSADTNPGDGVCTDGSGNCTLRAAIQEANALSGADRIHFNIPGGGPFIILVSGSPLPTLTDPVTLDALTQPGASCSSWPPTLLIQLDGSAAGFGADGLQITAGNSTVRGLIIRQFSGDGIQITTNGGNVIECNFIGTAVAGNSGSGVLINDSPNNRIGGSTTSARNLISRNDGGVQITGEASDNNTVAGNYIGTDANGTAALGQTGDGVLITNGADNNTIGGIAATPGMPPGNVISGNGVSTSDSGVKIVGSATTGNQVQGNLLGTDAAGANALGNTGRGVVIDDASNNTIGGTATGARNLISGNRSVGVVIMGSGNLVQGNFIGTDITGSVALGNTSGGMILLGPNNTVGGTMSNAGNTIAFNGIEGILILSATGNRVQRNSIHDNAQLGIDLDGGGVTANDPGDGDAGANNRQNFPVMATVQIAGNGDLVIQYSVDSIMGNSSYPLRVEFFKADGAGIGAEGNIFLGSDTYPDTQAQGSRVVNLGNAAALGVISGDPIVVTATDADGNTSEFTSPSVAVGTGASPTVVDIASFTAETTSGGTVVLRWETVSEIDIVGFNILRSDDGGRTYAQRNPSLIAAQSSGSSVGALYAFTDAAVPASGRYLYLLEVVRRDGSRERVGPVEGRYEFTFVVPPSGSRLGR